MGLPDRQIVGEGMCFIGQGVSQQEHLHSLRLETFDIIKVRYCQMQEFHTELAPCMGPDPPPEYCPLLADRNA